MSKHLSGACPAAVSTLLTLHTLPLTFSLRVFLSLARRTAYSSKDTEKHSKIRQQQNCEQTAGIRSPILLLHIHQKYVRQRISQNK